ncbi:17069_t:CDS:2 [Funneliformis caledonium]|uniref:17069_t:CDS:1 n=1 Tax=Funneliformis caledonium TaxID=1117310 RepID=A0A9N9DY76_9GLOM|nr:17069_t:CDS:2 [Funneliformis caledonium]
MASEPSTSTLEIQTDTSEPSQLEVLALNYLRNQEILTIPTRILKLNPCKTEPPLTCPLCNVIIELTREEVVLTSGKYHLQKKQTDTGQGNEKLMTSLRLVEGGSCAKQASQSKQVSGANPCTAPLDILTYIYAITDNLENQFNVNSGNDTNIQEKLSTLTKREKAENVDKKEDADGSISQSLAQLYQKATRTRLRITKG